MFSSFSRSVAAARAARGTLAPQGRRYMGGGNTTAERKGAIEKYKMLAIGGAVPVGGLIVYLFGLSSHDHIERPDVQYAYMHRRTRRFAWGDGDTPLFEKAHHDSHHH